MKLIKIGDREYTFEFTIEASLYKECTEKITRFMTRFQGAEGENAIEKAISSISDLPSTAMTLFYAGLMENHSDEIKSEKDAKKLVKQYFVEHKEDGTGNFYEIMTLMLECMDDDGFFSQIGLTQLVENAQAESKPKKVPQDHKKSTKATGK